MDSPRDWAFPAHAGMNRPQAAALRAGVRVPRACGDEPTVGEQTAEYIDAFPAHAGMNRGSVHHQHLAESVPRACGDEPVMRW